ncbi:cytochrome P450 [Trametes meyenii]|nr:cytochrome P450 [Trametes meyenii]
MSSTLVLLGALGLYGLWRLVRNFVLRSPLDILPGPPSGSFITGNILQIFNHNSWSYQRNLASTYGHASRLYGFFGTKWLHLYDLKAIHSVLVKDQELYTRSVVGNKGIELMIGPGLFAMQGPRHRRQRKMLTPAFSAAHMRDMTPFFHQIIDKLREAIQVRVAAGEKELDIAAWMGRTALELIGQGGLGHSFDPLTRESSDYYTEAVKAMVPSFNEVEWIRMFIPYFRYLGPVWLRRKILELVPHKGIQRLKDISDVMHSRALEIWAEKRKAVEIGDEAFLHRVGEGKDLMSILLRENMAADDEDKLPDDELVAQISAFILAGVDTTSNALSRILHLLALNTEVQNKLRYELTDARERYGEAIPYDELMQLPYLDAVCRETLRLYAPVTMMSREAHCDTVVPLAEPVRGMDGSLLHQIAIPKGTNLVLNVQACNTNKTLWGDDADEWKPERWLKPFPSALEEARVPGIYANLMTFGGGSYSCIGFKFSQLEMKVVLATLLPSFTFDLPDKPIIWNWAGVAYPTMGGVDVTRAELLLKIKPVKG